MFERRLKILFGLLILATAGLLTRAAQLQIVQATQWQERARENMTRTQLLETVRGDIVDFQGRRLAIDDACIDAAVDYRAIIRDPEWIQVQAMSRARQNPAYRGSDKAGRVEIVKQETARLHADLDEMWLTLARVAVPARTLDEIERTKAMVRLKVDLRRRQVWYGKFRGALREHENRDPDPWYREWLLSEEETPQVDQFTIDIAEQTEAHVILPAITPEAHNFLKKHIERFPGLALRPSKHRLYPYGAAAAHLLGRLSSVTAEDLRGQGDGDDELRQYYPNDLIGRTGVEQLCEEQLRGARGRIRRVVGQEQALSIEEPVRGEDVKLTIDIELQAQLEQAFRDVIWRNEQNQIIERHEMHGAAVVIDIATGQVRALACWPSYDLNRFDELYPTLVKDLYNRPLLNRATQLQLEPGSTVKPIVGLGAIANGLIGVDGTIECRGFLYIDGHRKNHGRCWVATKFLGLLGVEGVAGHKVPSSDPHPTGFLTFADALQRSCNVYFETLGDRMGLDGLSYWYQQFGLGWRTGLGIAESPGRLPIQFEGPDSGRRAMSWYSAIGQAQVLATPVQMANVAATIARDGVWVRPTLLADPHEPAPRESTDTRGDRVDLKLPPEALRAARDGMGRAINTRAGTGNALRRESFAFAGKTGTAQASRFAVPRQDEAGNILKDENGHTLFDHPSPSTGASPNRSLPWYRGSGTSGTDLAHAWFIGFAPLDKPQIAFAVVLEYGGSGGHDAGPIVNAVLDGCIEHGYLSIKP